MRRLRRQQVCVVSEHDGQHLLEPDTATVGSDLEEAQIDVGAVDGREALPKVRQDAREDALCLPFVDVREEEDRALAGHAKDGILDAERALDEVDHLGNEQIPLAGRQTHHHRRNPVAFGELAAPPEQIAQAPRVFVSVGGVFQEHHGACIDRRSGGLKRNLPAIVPLRRRSGISAAGGQSPSRLRGSPHVDDLRSRPPDGPARPPGPVRREGETERMREGRASQGRRSRERAARFARGFSLLLALAYGLMVLGALVRAHGAGLACPDWPLCFGELVPRLDFHVAFEWGHRVVAGSVSVIFTALAVGVARDSALRGAAGRPVLLAAALLVVQVVLGGLTVLHLLAAWTVTAHLVTGNAFALALLFVVLQLRSAAGEGPAAAEPITASLRTLVTAAAVVLALEIVLGGLVSSRYAGLACDQWPACKTGVFFPGFEGNVGIHLLHRLAAYALAVLLALAAGAARGIAGIARPAALAFALVVLQIGLGVTNVLLKIPVEVTGLHTATAVALVLTTATCVRAAWMHPLRAVESAAASQPC